MGLTGGIAMGKSTAARACRRLGVPVHDADAAVHRLYGRGGRAVPLIAAAFPEAVTSGHVDRAVLSRLITAVPDRLALLEEIMHPLVRWETRAWLKRMARRRQALVVLDIPLLYETGGEALCDSVTVMTAPHFLQRQRALARPGMTATKLDAILRRQVKDSHRRRRADHVIRTGLGKAFALEQLRRAVRMEREHRGRVWGPGLGRARGRSM